MAGRDRRSGYYGAAISRHRDHTRDEKISFESHRLKPGRHGLAPDQVRANQRWRLLGACAQVLSERGYLATTLREVVATAAVSKADFYRLFSSLPDCIAASYEMAAEALLAVAADASASAPDPQDTLPATVSAILAWLVEEPELGLMLTDPALLDVPGLAARRDRFTVALSRCLASAKHGQGLGQTPAGIELHLVRGARSWTARRLRTGSPAELPGRARELMGLLEASI